MLLGNIRYRKLFGLLSLLIVVSGPVSAQDEEMTGTMGLINREREAVVSLSSILRCLSHGSHGGV